MTETKRLWTELGLDRKQGKSWYTLCKCVCGVEKWVRKTSLWKDSFSCKKCSNVQRKHSASNTRLYNIWCAIKQRCYYKGSIGANLYGERGIEMHQDWKENFQSFKEWAENSGYSDKLSIDRVDVNGNYEPSNCRWATPHEQNRNQRTNIFFEKDGERLILKDWCKKLNINYDSVRNRLYMGWDIEKALFTPTRKVNRK